MNAADISARVRRLDKLSLGVAREIEKIAKEDIYLYRERRAYLEALKQLWGGLEAARVVLAKARQRMEG
jgi:hypothetical protein